MSNPNPDSTISESHQEPRRNSVASTRPPPPEAPIPPSDDSDDTPILFDQMTQGRRFFGFMNHSPHRVMYRNHVYPTATHLHEAMKYLPDHEWIAAQIRDVPNVLEVYQQSSRFADYQRPDWSDVFLQKMEEVLMLKFQQHADLRELLCGETGERRLVYADNLDSFWGVGPHGNGENQLGKVLMKVRRKLREEGGLR
ncbi:hypothetical protein NMY22_g19445 [Coprinellus aureogranulatus]|nr:hypothetical protein NMY22_g19445 [Coprinellus aureogranulatus]